MIIAIDLGGTKLLAVLLDDSLKPVDKRKIATPQTTDGDHILKLITKTVDELTERNACRKSDLEGLAVSVPSPVNEGIVLTATNIGFENYPLKDKLEKVTTLPVLVENDVNAGTYGEYKQGAGKGKKHIVGLYPGTGIGGALILDGRLYRGAGGGAGELGHVIVQTGGRLCGCGSYGCLEALASKTALAKDLVQLAVLGKSPSIFNAVGTDYTAIKSRHIKKALKGGEQAVIELVNRAAGFLGIGMANYVNIFNPERIILGGGLMEKLGAVFMKRAEKTMREHALPHLLRDVDVKMSELGDETVVIGGALLFRDEYTEGKTAQHV